MTNSEVNNTDDLLTAASETYYRNKHVLKIDVWGA